jgi:hypothetical protein
VVEGCRGLARTIRSVTCEVLRRTDGRKNDRRSDVSKPILGGRDILPRMASHRMLRKHTIAGGNSRVSVYELTDS